MTGADVLILLVLLGSTAIGLLRGFVREAASLVFWIIAIWAAWKFGSVVEPHLGGLLADPNIAPWIGRLVILVLVLLVGWVVGMLLSYFTRSLGLGPLDRVIGLLFGAHSHRRGTAAFESRRVVESVQTGSLRGNRRRLAAGHGRRARRTLGEARAPYRGQDPCEVARTSFRGQDPCEVARTSLQGSGSVRSSADVFPESRSSLS